VNPSPSDYNVASFISESDNEDSTTKTYFCNYCNTKLNFESTDEATGKNSFWCYKCGITFYPANQLVKRVSKFETPQGPNKEPLTASVDNSQNNMSLTAYSSKGNLPPLFKDLAGKGFKWLHYEER
jgi:hypothetical protein